MKNPLSFNLDKFFSVFLVGFFLVNLFAYQNQTIPFFWKLLVFVLAFSGVIMLVLASDFLGEIGTSKGVEKY